MPPNELACMSILSYRFRDGMIHDSLVPRYVRGVALAIDPRSPINFDPRFRGSSSAQVT